MYCQHKCTKLSHCIRHFSGDIDGVATAEEMLGDCAGDTDVRHTPGADLADHLDWPLALTRALGTVMPS